MDENAIRNTFKEFETAFNRHEPKAISDFWTEDCDHTDLDGRRAKGRQELLKLMTEIHSTVFKGATLHLTLDSTRSLGNDIVACDGSWELSGAHTPDGKSVGTLRGKVLSLLRNENGRYRMLISRPFVPYNVAERTRAAA